MINFGGSTKCHHRGPNSNYPRFHHVWGVFFAEIFCSRVTRDESEGSYQISAIPADNTDHSGHGRPNHVAGPRTLAALASSAFYRLFQLVAVIHLADSSPHDHHAVHTAPVVFICCEEEDFGPCCSQQCSQKDLGSAVRS